MHLSYINLILDMILEIRNGILDYLILGSYIGGIVIWHCLSVMNKLSQMKRLKIHTICIFYAIIVLDKHENKSITNLNIIH